MGRRSGRGFFAATVLPRLAAEREIAEATTLDLMELPEEALVLLSYGSADAIQAAI